MCPLRSPVHSRQHRTLSCSKHAGNLAHNLPAANRASPRHRASTQVQAASRQQVYQELFSALTTQFRKESLPWIRELVEPLLAGPPSPITDTVDPEDLADADSRFIKVNNLNIHYKEYQGLLNTSASAQQAAELHTHSSDNNGTSSTHSTQPVILMLHGLNGSEFNWRLVAQPLADHVTAHVQGSYQAAGKAGTCRVIAYDRPPYGLSDRPVDVPLDSSTDNPYTLNAGVELARGVITSLNLGRVVAMGHSAGAPIAMELAARYPELVSGVVLVSPAISTNEKGFLATADLGRLMRFFYIRALVSLDGPGLNYVRQQIYKQEQQVRQGNLGMYYHDVSRAPEEVVEGFLRPLRAHDWDRATLQVFRSFGLTSQQPSWEGVQAPVLIVQGDRDNAVPAHSAKAVADKLQSHSASSVVQYVELPSCGHLPMEELPAEFTAHVATFICSHCV